MSFSKESKLNETLTDLILSSTCHGIPSVFRTKRLCLKIMWIIFFIGCSSFCIYSINNSIMSFLDYEVVTKIELIPENPTQFPTVTLCNLNAKNSKYNLNETIIECQFNGNSCSLTEFNWFFQPNLGFCFMFNSGKNQFNQKIPIENSILAGFIFGLKLTIYADPENTTSKEPLSSGFRVFINNHTNIPNPNFGYNIPIGFDSALTVRRDFSQKLGDPYNSCKRDMISIDSYHSSIFKEMISRNLTYSQRDCLGNLALKQSSINCSCEGDLEKLAEICSKKSFQCLSKFYNTYFLNNDYDSLSKQCPLECMVIDYKISTSSTDIKIKDIRTLINDNPIFKSKYETNEISYRSLKNTILEVTVYYEDLSYTMISQTAKTNLIDLISNCGGLLGLFIGTSFLSFAELIEMLLEIVFIYFENKKTLNENQVMKY